MTPAQQLAALTERDLSLVLSGAPEEAVQQRAALVAACDPRDPAFRRAVAAQALISQALATQRDEVGRQLRDLAPARSAARAYAASTRT